MNTPEDRGFSPNTIQALRLVDEQEFSLKRQQLQSDLIFRIDTLAIPSGLRRAGIPGLEVYQQQSNDTCLLACLIAVKRSLARSQGRAYAPNEASLAEKAREQGLLANGGIIGNERTQVFIREELSLDSELYIGSSDIKLEKIAEALRKGYFPLVAYSMGSIGHWVVVNDIQRVATGVEVSLMNPMRTNELERISKETFISRLMSDELKGSGSVESSLLIIKNPYLPTVLARRQGPGNDAPPHNVVKARR
ncbi:MAG TPA: hypothetical protein VD999_00765 [Vitreimonas sp.]|nr:hypothetical protein [Vitreimonas sp.]